MQTRTLVTSAVAIASLVAGAALARSVNIIHGTSNVSYRSATASTASPAPQSTGTYVFACVSKSGKIDYLEFRLPLPHQCWFSGESLWHLAAVRTLRSRMLSNRRDITRRISGRKVHAPPATPVTESDIVGRNTRYTGGKGPQ
jgi:hypothetical protein